VRPRGTGVLYVVATGGGRAAGRAVQLLSVAGSVAKPVRAVTVNELTTVGSAYALAQFARGAAVRGASPGLENAAATAVNLITPTTGGRQPGHRRSSERSRHRRAGDAADAGEHRRRVHPGNAAELPAPVPHRAAPRRPSAREHAAGRQMLPRESNAIRPGPLNLPAVYLIASTHELGAAHERLGVHRQRHAAVAAPASPTAASARPRDRRGPAGQRLDRQPRRELGDRVPGGNPNAAKVFVSGSGELAKPFAIAIDARGTKWVTVNAISNTLPGMVTRIDAKGNVRTRGAHNRSRTPLAQA